MPAASIQKTAINAGLLGLIGTVGTSGVKVATSSTGRMVQAAAFTTSTVQPKSDKSV